MRNFQLIASNVDVVPLLLELNTHPKLWNQNLLRTTFENSPHREVDDIWLRFQDLALYEDKELIMDAHESVNYPAMKELPAARKLVFDLMARVQGERLGRVLITRLSPGKRVYSHVDSGDHASYYERFHVVLQCPPGALFRAEDETVQMVPGQVWWFNNAAEHEVVNTSNDDRIVLIVDIKTSK